MFPSELSDRDGFFRIARARLRVECPKSRDGQRPQPPDVHDADDDDLRQGMQRGGDAGRKPDRAERGGHFKQILNEFILRLQNAEDKRAKRDDKRGEQRNDKGFAYDLRRNTALKRAGRATRRGAAHRQKKRKKRGGFDTAARRAGRRANEHQAGKKEKTRVRKIADGVG